MSGYLPKYDVVREVIPDEELAEGAQHLLSALDLFKSWKERADAFDSVVVDESGAFWAISTIIDDYCSRHLLPLQELIERQINDRKPPLERKQSCGISARSWRMTSHRRKARR